MGLAGRLNAFETKVETFAFDKMEDSKTIIPAILTNLS
jgi:hypothetical protein